MVPQQPMKMTRQAGLPSRQTRFYTGFFDMCYQSFALGACFSLGAQCADCGDL